MDRALSEFGPQTRGKVQPKPVQTNVEDRGVTFGWPHVYETTSLHAAYLVLVAESKNRGLDLEITTENLDNFPSKRVKLTEL